MKPFDLQKALAGEPVVTRGGLVASQLHRFDLKGDRQPVACVIGGKVETFTDDGRWHLAGRLDYLDLFMATKKRTVYVNVYRGSCYDSSEEAVYAGGGCGCIAVAVPVEIEE